MNKISRLKYLRYSGSSLTKPSEQEKIFKALFNGLTAEEARTYFNSEYMDTDGHFIWYSDLNNY